MRKKVFKFLNLLIFCQLFLSIYFSESAFAYTYDGSTDASVSDVANNTIENVSTEQVQTDSNENQVPQTNVDNSTNQLSDVNEDPNLQLVTKNVSNEQGLYDALKDNEINIVNIMNDIVIENYSTFEVTGDHKKILGNGYKLSNSNTTINFNCNVKVDFTNVEFVSPNYSQSITMPFGGNLFDINGPKLSIYSTTNTNVDNSIIGYLQISSSSSSKISDSKLQSIHLGDCDNVVIDHVEVNPQDGSNGITAYYGSMNINNSNISGGENGIYLFRVNTQLSEVVIEGSQYGIYNDGGNDYSPVYLSNVEVNNVGRYGILNTADEGRGYIQVKPDTTLTLRTNDKVGIYQKNGSLDIYGNIMDEGTQYTVISGSNSSVYDSNETLNLVDEKGSLSLYLAKNRGNDVIQLTTAQVSTEEELREALQDEKVNVVQIMNDIEIKDGTPINVVGLLKKIEGGNYKLYSNDIYVGITFNDFSELENLNLESLNTNIDFRMGGNVNHVVAPKTYFSINGAVNISNSDLMYVSVSGGTGSRISASKLQSLNLGSCNNVVIDHVELNPQDGSNGLSAYYGSLTISNSKISGGQNGIYLFRVTAQLSEVVIEGSQYGIYNDAGSDYSLVYLSNVEINNVGRYGILSTADEGRPYIQIKPDTTLTLRTNDKIGIYQKNGSLDAYGNIIDEGTQYTVISGSNTSVYDPNETLNLVEEKGSLSLYLAKNRGNDEIQQNTAQVSNEEELRKALQDEKVNVVQIMNDIEIKDGTSINVVGLLKKIEGGNYKLYSNDIYVGITFNEFSDLENLNLESLNTNIEFRMGGNLNHVVAPKTFFTINGTVNISNSDLMNVTVSGGSGSKILDSKLQSISLGSCNNVVINHVEFNPQDGWNGITAYYGSLNISNSKISGGASGIDINRTNTTVAETKIDSTTNYGIYLDGLGDYVSLSLSNVNISNVGDYGIYCPNIYGSSRGSTITIEPDSYLTLNTNRDKGIYLKNNYFNLQGAIEYNNSGNIVYADYLSNINDPSGQLTCLNPDSESFKKYVGKSSYISISGVLANGVYSTSRSINYTGGTARLNGITIENGFIVEADGQYDLTVTNTFGETKTINFQIDKSAPIISGVVDKAAYNKDVSISFNEGIATLDDDEFTSGTTVSAEGVHKLVVTDTATNVTTATFSIDKTNPVITIGQYNTNPTNQDITVPATTNEGTLNAESHTFTENGSFTFIATDEAGNTTSQTITITNIEKVAPVVTGVSDNEFYNEDKTITYNEGTAILDNEDFTSGTTVSAEGFHKLVVTDTAGNVTTVTFTIDKTPPVLTIGPYNTDPTNKDITVTATTNEGTLNAESHTFTENGLFTFKATDEAGNTTSQTVKISNIDKVVPVITIAPYNTVSTNQEITVFATTDKGTLNAKSHTFTENGSFEFIATDSASNTTTQTVTITNIDRVAPIITVAPYNTESTNQDITVTATTNEGTLNAESHTFTENGSFTFIATDEAGNTTSKTVKIDNIKKIYTITFNPQGGSAVANKTAIYNSTIVAPTTPIRTGYTFGGWYKDAAFTKVWNFAEDKVMYNTTLYAKWIPNPAVPTSLKAISSSYNSVKVSWGSVAGMSGYEVYRATSMTGSFKLITSTTANSYNNTGLTTNNIYYYKVRAYKLVGTAKLYSNYSAIISVKPVPATPTSVKAASLSYNSVRTSWAAVSGASGYEVYRATSSTGTYSHAGSTTSTNFINKGLTTNKPYYYKVRAYKTIGSTKVYSNFSAVTTAKPVPSVPVNFKATRLSSKSIKLTWGAESGASGYEIYRSTSKSGTYSLLKSTTSIYYINSSLTTGKTYYYKLRAYRTIGATKVYSGWTTIISAKP